MCGRYALFGPKSRSRTVDHPYFAGLEEFPDTANVAPSLVMPIARLADGRAELLRARWGLVPCWAKDWKVGYKMINARVETLATNKTYGPLYRRKQRCLVPASGFYEWKKAPSASLDGSRGDAAAGDAESPSGAVIGEPESRRNTTTGEPESRRNTATGEPASRRNAATKRQQPPRPQPYYISSAGDELLAFAGLWERWRQPDGEVLITYTIVTGPPNELVAPLHDRMPVMLDPSDYERWLTGEDPGDLLEPYPAGLLRAEPAQPELLSPVRRVAGSSDS